ncbi:hypothetical protein NL108_016428 [Boleophthalmus pectinirostris]|nr:hypothetical protein NL108_016428 [Boleophthalmus pectinirostris]
MENYHDVVGQLIKYFHQRINLYVVVILAFSYHFIFEKDLPCTCGHAVLDCILYMLLPFLIILSSAVEWTEPVRGLSELLLELLLFHTFTFVQCDFCEWYLARLSSHRRRMECLLL